MNGGKNSYYDPMAYPVLLQLAVATCALFILIVFVTFFCCIEITRFTSSSVS